MFAVREKARQQGDQMLINSVEMLLYEIQKLVVYDTRSGCTTDYFFNARLLSQTSFELIFPDFINMKLEKIQYEGELDKTEYDQQLFDAISDVEIDQQVYILEIVVGKGNNSRE